MGWTIKFGPTGTNKAGGLGGTGTSSRAITGLGPSLRATESPGNLGPSNLVGGRQETPARRRAELERGWEVEGAGIQADSTLWGDELPGRNHPFMMSPPEPKSRL